MAQKRLREAPQVSPEEPSEEFTHTLLYVVNEDVLDGEWFFGQYDRSHDKLWETAPSDRRGHPGFNKRGDISKESPVWTRIERKQVLEFQRTNRCIVIVCTEVE